MACFGWIRPRNINSPFIRDQSLFKKSPLFATGLSQRLFALTNARVPSNISKKNFAPNTDISVTSTNTRIFRYRFRQEQHQCHSMRVPHIYNTRKQPKYTLFCIVFLNTHSFKGNMTTTRRTKENEMTGMRDGRAL